MEKLSHDWHSDGHFFLTHTHTKGEIVDTSTVKWNNRLIYLNKKTSLYIFLPEVWDFKHYRSGNNGNTVLIQVLIEFFLNPKQTLFLISLGKSRTLYYVKRFFTEIHGLPIKSI